MFDTGWRSTTSDGIYEWCGFLLELEFAAGNDPECSFAACIVLCD